MLNPDMTYEDYLQMLETKEQLENYREKQAEIRKWIDDNIPMYKPESRFIVGNLEVKE